MFRALGAADHDAFAALNAMLTAVDPVELVGDNVSPMSGSPTSPPKGGMAAGALWTNLLWLQSAGFVSLGVSVKLLLKQAVKASLPAKYAWLMCGSLVILEVEDMAAAEGWAENDPYTKAGLFESVELIPWKKVI